ncbi:glycosyltransferase [Humidisolicoccus flavus]|uniref:glycosyltransferase n=1 Tax=Humidisolicoccus flavus TaxID=3111414 RepID=UPI003255202B
MTTLQYVIERVSPTERSRDTVYGEELLRAMTINAPTGVEVELMLPAVDEEELDRLRESFPGLTAVHPTTLSRRELRIAWQRSMTTKPIEGLVHAASLFAPLRRSDGSSNGQSVVTVSSLAWLEKSKAPSGARHQWFSRMISRSERYADAVVVPTHALAVQLASLGNFGDRIRVIAAAPTPSLVLAKSDPERSELLGLPEAYVHVVTRRYDVDAAQRAVDAIADSGFPDLPVVVTGPVSWKNTSFGEMLVNARLTPGRVIMLGNLCDRDLAIVVRGAAVSMLTSTQDEFGLDLLDALALETPVVHSENESLAEIADGTTTSIALADGASGFARAIATVVDEASRSTVRQQVVRGADRARWFHWSDTAQQIWQLHADL